MRHNLGAIPHRSDCHSAVPYAPHAPVIHPRFELLPPCYTPGVHRVAHHGAIFIPAATRDSLSPVVRDYDNYRRMYAATSAPCPTTGANTTPAAKIVKKDENRPGNSSASSGPSRSTWGKRCGMPFA